MRPEQVIAVQKDREPRLIGDPATWKRARFGWLESVRRDTSLSPIARLVAHVLVMDFCNRDTLRCDPSYDEIGAVVGKSKHTIRRAVADLFEAGWIVTEGGCGRGVSRGYGFLTRAEIIHLKGSKTAPLKGSRNATFSDPQKVADLQPKGSKTATAYNNDINHGKTNTHAGARARTREGTRRFSPDQIEEARQLVRWVEAGNPTDGVAIPRHLIACALAQKLITQDWLDRWGLAEKEGSSDD